MESSAAKIFFTGSVEVGRGVGVACAERMKGSVLELGGKDPMLVLVGRQPRQRRVRRALGRLRQRRPDLLGHRARVRDARRGRAFIEGLVAGAKALRVGDPMGWGTEIGPMVSREQFDLVRELVDDAVADGAELRCGGPVAAAGAPERRDWFAPAVLTGVTHDMRIMREEIFGPVVPVITVDSEDEAIALANDSDFGLGASVWTLDRERGDRIARRLQAGMVWVNDHMYSHGACSCSWGGVKDSGLGRSHSKFGFYECVNVKLLSWEPSRTRNFWWHPYDGPRPGDALVGAAALRPRRRQGGRAAPRRARVRAAHAEDAGGAGAVAPKRAVTRSPCPRRCLRATGPRALPPPAVSPTPGRGTPPGARTPASRAAPGGWSWR